MAVVAVAPRVVARAAQRDEVGGPSKKRRQRQLSPVLRQAPVREPFGPSSMPPVQSSEPLWVPFACCWSLGGCGSR